jgi:hypothetical protein
MNAWGPLSLSKVTFQKDVAPAGKALLFAENRGGIKLEQVQVLYLPSLLCIFEYAAVDQLRDMDMIFLTIVVHSLTI